MMPSTAFKYMSEPVHLANNEENPYKPPQELGPLQPGHPVRNAKTYLLNGTMSEKKAASKPSEDAAIGQPKRNQVDKIEVGVNEKTKNSEESQGKTSSRKSGDQAIPSRGSLVADISHNGSDLPNGQTIFGSKTLPQGTAELRTQLPALKNTDLIHQRRAGAKGHGRAHSASSPATPTSLISSIVGQDVGFTSSDNPTSARQSSTSLHKSSIPSIFHTGHHVQNAHSSKSLHASAPKLISRHTLEVPRVSTSRSSRDFSYPNTMSDGGSDSGRLSPAPRTPRPSNTLIRPGTRSIQSDMFLDEIPQNEEMARWTEQVRAKRASRRKRKEEEEDDRVLVGTKVDKDHANWITAYNMLTGIRFTVSRTNAKIDRELTDADFNAKHKLSFDV